MAARRIGIVGAGPAGLMAAEAAAGQGAEVHVFDAMPSVGRKFLMAGKSGLNLTHAEPHEALRKRYGASIDRLGAALDAFDGAALRQWAEGLGVETFIGSSGRVFPKAMKGSPLLRAWLKRLGELGVVIYPRHRMVALDGHTVRLETPVGPVTEHFDTIVLALGGASWARLGSDAAWVPLLHQHGVKLAPFRPANCAFEVAWSPVFTERNAGAPVKAVTAQSTGEPIPGEFVVTRFGIEGSLVYAHSAALRDQLEATGKASLRLDLVPGRSLERLAADIARQKPKESFANRMRKAAGLDGVKFGLLRELVPEAASLAPEVLAEKIKALDIPLLRTRPMDEAISVAGGVRWDSVTDDYELKAMPGVFVAGEMLDWEAPTGGYLLTACYATGRAAGLAAARA